MNKQLDKQNKKILFIAWDNPSSNYLEGLFAPIFEELTRKFAYEFHVIQFSWASQSRIQFLQAYCHKKGIAYTHVPVTLKPVLAVGKFLTIFRGVRLLKEYIFKNGIDVLMPRSTMPAAMVLRLKKTFPSIKIVFDADGLPIEERVDFARLAPGSLRHKNLKKIESQIVRSASVILCRTEKARVFLSSQYGVESSRFFVVVNGRDHGFFVPSDEREREELKRELNLPSDSFVNVYCGSLGPQYGLEQMLYIHRILVEKNNRYHFLVLTNNPSYVENKLTSNDRNITVRKVGFEQIPKYLSVGDAGLAIRKATFSMQGVAPIKIGEYLLIGLPVVASAGIGDTESLLINKHFAFVAKDYSEESLNDAANWILGLKPDDKMGQEARMFGIKNFSLEQSVESYNLALESAIA